MPYRKESERVQMNYFPLKGGEDLVTPAMEKAPGSLIFSQNYESVDNGYRRADGYERYDGQAKPSDTMIYAIPFDAGSIEPSLGLRLYGETSGATGVVCGYAVTSGSWVGNDAAGFIAVSQLAGTFANDENITDVAPSGFSSGFSSGFE